MAYHSVYGHSNNIINLAAGNDASGYYNPNGGGYRFNESTPGIFFNFIFISGENHALGSRLTNEPGYLFGLSLYLSA